MTESRSSEPQYEMGVERDVFVEMPDGVRLALDLYRPNADGEFPALLTMTPYGKDIEDTDVPPLELDEGGFEFAHVEGTDSEFWARRGYTHVIADVRGCGKSEGEYENLISDREAEDGYELVEWIADQSWCDGGVGMVGISYLAFVQFLVAAKRPPSLEAIFPLNGWGDTYRDVMYHGGIQSGFFQLDGLIADHSAVSVSEHLYDEEELRRKVDELLADEGENVANAPTLKEVLLNADINPIWFDILLNREYNDFWKERCPAEKMDRIEVPCYLGCDLHSKNVAMHLPGATHWGWERISTGKKLRLSPDVPTRPFKDSTDAYHREMLRWYDYHLKGIDTGIMDDPAVEVWVRGADAFRYGEEWPLSGTNWMEYYLAPDEELTTGPPDGNPSYSEIEYERRYPGGIFSGLPVGSEPEHLTFATPPLERDVEVVGPIALVLHASLSAEDGHFIATLKDVAPDGSNRVLSRGWLKASHREIDEELSEPWRPYHPHTDPEPVTPGEVTEYRIEIMPISNRFEASHRIQLEIWPTDYPVEEDHDETLSWGVVHHVPHGEDVTYRIHHDRSSPSHLLLPIVGDEG